jgi:hypothetical protein
MAKIGLPAQNISIQRPHGEIDPIWYEKLKTIGLTIDGHSTQLATILGASALRASLGADVLLNNTANYFDGPSIAQGTVGTWWVSGTVSVFDTAGACIIDAKLWDGTTVIASAYGSAPLANVGGAISLSGWITNPAGNLKISVRDQTAATGKILFNSSGNSRDSTISAFRIA